MEKTYDKKDLVLLLDLAKEYNRPPNTSLYTIRSLGISPIYIREQVDLYYSRFGKTYKQHKKLLYVTKKDAERIKARFIELNKEKEKKGWVKESQSKQAEETGLVILRDILEEYGLSKEYGLKALDKLNIPRRYINTTRSVYYSKSDCRREVPTKMCAVTPDEADKVRQVLEQKGTYNKTKQKNINIYDGDLLKKVKAHYKQIQLKPTPHYIVKRYDVPMSKAARICAILNNGG